jgi:hypothetical protein
MKMIPPVKIQGMRSGVTDYRSASLRPYVEEDAVIVMIRVVHDGSGSGFNTTFQLKPENATYDIPVSIKHGVTRDCFVEVTNTFTMWYIGVSSRMDLYVTGWLTQEDLALGDLTMKDKPTFLDYIRPNLPSAHVYTLASFGYSPDFYLDEGTALLVTMVDRGENVSSATVTPYDYLDTMQDKLGSTTSGYGGFAVMGEGGLRVTGEEISIAVHGVVRFPIVERETRGRAITLLPCAVQGQTVSLPKNRWLSYLLDVDDSTGALLEYVSMGDVGGPSTFTHRAATDGLSYTMYGYDGGTTFGTVTTDAPALLITGGLLDTTTLKNEEEVDLVLSVGEGQIRFASPQALEYNLDIVFHVEGGLYDTTTAAGLAFYLSGGSSNTDRSLSLGGGISTTSVLAGSGLMFTDVTDRKSRIGITDLFCFYITNEGASALYGCVVYVPVEPTSGSDILLSVAAEGVNSSVQQTTDSEIIGNEIDFTNTNSPQTGIEIPVLAPGDFIGVWVGRRADQGNLLSSGSDSFELRVAVIDNKG